MVTSLSATTVDGSIHGRSKTCVLDRPSIERHLFVIVSEFALTSI